MIHLRIYLLRVLFTFIILVFPIITAPAEAFEGNGLEETPAPFMISEKQFALMLEDQFYVPMFSAVPGIHEQDGAEQAQDLAFILSDQEKGPHLCPFRKHDNTLALNGPQDCI